MSGYSVLVKESDLDEIQIKNKVREITLWPLSDSLPKDLTAKAELAWHFSRKHYSQLKN